MRRGALVKRITSSGARIRALVLTGIHAAAQCAGANTLISVTAIQTSRTV
jgi:hypothetical protein